jgi:hypothetical protein
MAETHSAAPDLDAVAGVATFVALGGITDSGPSALWQLAEANGWSLEDFVIDLLAHVAPAL